MNGEKGEGREESFGFSLKSDNTGRDLTDIRERVKEKGEGLFGTKQEGSRLRGPVKKKTERGKKGTAGMSVLRGGRFWSRFQLETVLVERGPPAGGRSTESISSPSTRKFEKRET